MTPMHPLALDKATFRLADVETSAYAELHHQWPPETRWAWPPRC